MKPLQLLSTGDDGSELKLNQEVLTLVENEKRNVTVISIIGPYRTGKSYLMNRLTGKSTGFDLGSTVQAQTKGIWLWMGDFPGDSSRCLILLDVEGLSDAEKGNASHDLNLFVFSLLVSSVFIYNTRSTIDAAALDGLHLATKISDELMANPEEEENFAQHFPDFVWVVRDHHLELVINGKNVSPDEYLDHCLKPKKGCGAKVASYNSVRDAIRNYFPSRHCFVFPQPIENMLDLNNLDKVSDDKLTQGFKEASRKFETHIFSNIKPKVIRGSHLNGRGFSALVQSYLTSILSKKIHIQSTHEYVMNSENTRAMEEAIKTLDLILEKELARLPVSLDTFVNVVEVAKTNSIKVFLSSCMNLEQNQAFMDNLNETITEKITKIGIANQESSSAKCRGILEKLYEPVGSQMKDTYMQPGGYKLLKNAVDQIIKTYHEMSLREELGPSKGQVLKEFQESRMNPDLDHVMAADGLLTEMMRKQEKTLLETEQAKEENRRIKEEGIQLQEAQEKMMAAHQKNMEEIKEKISMQHQQEMDLYKKQIENEMLGMRQSEEANRQAMAEQHRETVMRLQNEITQARERSDREIQRISEAANRGNKGDSVLGSILSGVFSGASKFFLKKFF